MLGSGLCAAKSIGKRRHVPPNQSLSGTNRLLTATGVCVGMPLKSLTLRIAGGGGGGAGNVTSCRPVCPTPGFVPSCPNLTPCISRIVVNIYMTHLNNEGTSRVSNVVYSCVAYGSHRKQGGHTLLSSKRRPHYWSWNEQKYGHGARNLCWRRPAALFTINCDYFPRQH
jgi:hypothetical protein